MPTARPDPDPGTPDPGNPDPGTPNPGQTDPGFRFLAAGGAPASASARAALTAAARTPRLDRATALSFLAFGEYQAYHSFFEGLALVPMRCPVQADPERGQVVRDGQAPAALDPASCGAGQAAAALRARIEEAVGDALERHDRAGVWLSGGDDSAAVAAAAASLWRRWARNPETLRFYHQEPAHGDPETPAAQRIADALGHPLIVVRDAVRDPFAGMRGFFGDLDFPLDGAGCAQMLAFAARQADDGVQVYLTGDGGDECFGPRDPGRGWRGALRTHLPAVVRRPLQRADRLRQLPGWLRRRREEMRDLQHAPRARTGLGGIAADRDRAIRCARQSALVGLHRATAARCGLRVAFPLLAPRVMDLAVSVPQALHGDRTRPKRLLKQAYEDTLPSAALARTKADQPYAEGPAQTEVQRYGAAWRQEWLRAGRLETLGLVSPAEIDAAMAGAAEGPRALYRVFALVGLEIWARGWDLAR